MKKYFFLTIVLSNFSFAGCHQMANLVLKREYERSCSQPCDINEHVHRLRELAAGCSSVGEIGLRSMVSTWGILQGLSESASDVRSYVGIDLDGPPREILELASIVAADHDIDFRFIQANDLEIQIEPVDLLFIDSLHTYAHLTYELETFSSSVNRYIAMHDTSEPFAFADCISYRGDYSEYPEFVNRQKRGTWIAVWDFLGHHPEWRLKARHFNNYGFTILERVAESGR